MKSNFKSTDNLFSKILHKMQSLQFDSQITRHFISLDICNELSLHQLLIQIVETQGTKKQMTF